MSFVLRASSAPLVLALLQLGAASTTPVRQNYMDCGSGVALCGTLTLETGRGPGEYHHEYAHVHGLWPE
eukprot:CAMPEP_0171260660 /NCGR_PEP_ID=MMETSP0790-20130122/55570_1 /TAXON_ID=2925 /ORGANISM="Alexandrium catenella, Strain OF101" /LENGTH=68 /DNA_ID=CAMNT_0011728997 /DNA_START=66 /DNA_END=269 /DNA_ORIENTATION=+